MTKSKLPKSVRKYIRREKARIRREISDLMKQKAMIDELYRNVYGKMGKKTKIKLEQASKIEETSQLS